jgi:hypothetical protein
VSRGQRGGSPTVVNLSFLDRISHVILISHRVYAVVHLSTVAFATFASNLMGRSSFIMNMFHVLSQWTILLAGHEAFEGVRTNEDA